MPETTLHRPRKRALALFAATLAATLGFAGLTVASSSPASAHTPNASATCEKVTVTTASYSAGADNTVTVEIDGTTVEDDTSFSTSFSKDYAFANSSEAHAWVVKVYTSDDPDGSLGYSVTDTGTSTPCTPVPPTVEVSSTATTCAPDGTSVGTISAVVDGDAENGFTVDLIDADGAIAATRSADGPATVTFEGLPSNSTYTVRVTDAATDAEVSSEAITVPACVQPPVTPTPTPTPTPAAVADVPSTPAAAPTGTLAETGFEPAPIGVLAVVVLLVGGAAAFGTRRRATR